MVRAGKTGNERTLTHSEPSVGVQPSGILNLLEPIQLSFVVCLEIPLLAVAMD